MLKRNEKIFNVFTQQKMVTKMKTTMNMSYRMIKQDMTMTIYMDIPFLGRLFSVLMYLFKKYRCHILLQFTNILNRRQVEEEKDDTYGSHNTATPVIFYPNDFSGYNTSGTSSYATTPPYLDKGIL